MAQDEHQMLGLLKFELKFIEDGGYGRSPRAPWRPPYILEDSPSCPNLGDPARTHPCSECQLIKFVPRELRARVRRAGLFPSLKRGRPLTISIDAARRSSWKKLLLGGCAVRSHRSNSGLQTRQIR